MAISRAQMPSQLRGNRMEEKAGFDSTGDDARDLEIIRMGKGGKTKKKKKSKSRVNEAGNYTKPGMRKRLFNRIKAGGKGGAQDKIKKMEDCGITIANSPSKIGKTLFDKLSN